MANPHPTPRVHPPRLPLAPLYRLSRAPSVEQFAEWLGMDTKQVQNLNARGVRADKADALCVALGLTPGCVWPEVWYDLPLPPEDKIDIPKRSHARKKVDA